MSDKVIKVYTLPDCPLCKKVERILDKRGECYQVLDCDALVAGKVRDRVALAQYHLQNSAPVVVGADGKAVEIVSILADNWS